MGTLKSVVRHENTKCEQIGVPLGATVLRVPVVLSLLLLTRSLNAEVKGFLS